MQFSRSRASIPGNLILRPPPKEKRAPLSFAFAAAAKKHTLTILAGARRVFFKCGRQDIQILSYADKPLRTSVCGNAHTHWGANFIC